MGHRRLGRLGYLRSRVLIERPTWDQTHATAAACMRAAIFAFGSALLSCTHTQRAEMTEQYYSPNAAEAATCERSSASGYADPEALARAYVERDGRGEHGSSRTNQWLVRAHYCPIGLPGWDIITVVKEATIDSLVVEGPQAHAYVTYRRLGTADGVSFTPTLDNEQVRLPLVRLENGWRLNVFQHPHFLVATALAWPTLPDSVRAVIRNLARN